MKPKVSDVMSKLSAKEPMGEDMMDVVPEEEESSSAEEVDAMKMFEKASGPEQKAEALKMFLKACGVY